MSALGAMHPPPPLGCIYPAQLTIANTDMAQRINRRGIRKCRTGAHVLAQSAISMSSKTGSTGPPLRNHSRIDNGLPSTSSSG